LTAKALLDGSLLCRQPTCIPPYDSNVTVTSRERLSLSYQRQVTKQMKQVKYIHLYMVVVHLLDVLHIFTSTFLLTDRDLKCFAYVYDGYCQLTNWVLQHQFVITTSTRVMLCCCWI